MSEVTVGHGGSGSAVPRLGDPLLDEYLGFVAARARHNTVLAQAFDLKVFFSVVAKDCRCGTCRRWDLRDARTPCDPGSSGGIERIARRQGR